MGTDEPQAVSDAGLRLSSSHTMACRDPCTSSDGRSRRTTTTTCDPSRRSPGCHEGAPCTSGSRPPPPNLQAKGGTAAPAGSRATVAGRRPGMRGCRSGSAERLQLRPRPRQPDWKSRAGAHPHPWASEELIPKEKVERMLEPRLYQTIPRLHLCDA